jgi:hypothetical protein
MSFLLLELVHDTHRCGQFWVKSKNGVYANAITQLNLCTIFDCENNKCSHAWNIIKEIRSLKGMMTWPQGCDTTPIMAYPSLR